MSEVDDATARFYDGMWSDWGDVEGASPAAYHRRRLVVELIREHAPTAERLLEAGCGPGHLLKQLARDLPALALSAGDVSPGSLAVARRACPKAELFLLDLEAPDFEVRHAARFGGYDVVVASEVIEHLGDDEGGLVRLKALLAPGGVGIVTVPGGPRTRFDLAIGHVRHYSRESLSEVLAGAGFEVERVMAWGFPFHTLYRALVHVASRISLRSNGSPSAPRAPLVLGYRALGAVLTPLYFLNRPYWGSQLFAVARKPRA